MFFRRSILLALYKLSDIVILFCSLLSSAVVYNYCVTKNLFHGISHRLFTTQIEIKELLMIVIIMELWHVIFKSFNLYRSRRFGKRLIECWDIIKATTLGSILVSLFMFFFYPTTLSLIYIFTFWITSTILTILLRMTMRLLLIEVRNMGRNLRNVIIVGTNQRAKEFAKDIVQCKDLGYRLVGFIDTNHRNIFDDSELLADIEDFSEVLRQFVIDEVIIALPIKSSYDQIREVVDIATEQGIIVRYLADLFDMQFFKSNVDDFHGSPILTIHNGPVEDWTFMLKRAIDIIASVMILILLFPLFVFVGILIKFDSPGPVFFIQERIGYNKRRFSFYKFRTMIKDAEKIQSEIEHLNEQSGPVFKIKNDPRITRFGKFLRKTSIDELPQLFNVLMGDMSLVGPRPLPLRDFNGFDVNWHKRRFSVKPGVTCLWQVMGRNELSFHEWMRLDLEYIDNWSFLLDLKIILKTIPAVLKCNGAN